MRRFLFCPLVFDGVGGQGSQSQYSYDGEGYCQDKDLGDNEVADADGDAVGEIVEPMVDEPPTGGQGDEGGDDGQADEVAGYETKDVEFSRAQDLADANFLCSL